MMSAFHVYAAPVHTTDMFILCGVVITYQEALNVAFFAVRHVCMHQSVSQIGWYFFFGESCYGDRNRSAI